MSLSRRAFGRLCSGLALLSSSATAVRGGTQSRRETSGSAWRVRSGIHPHLAVFNDGGATQDNECGIGAVVPWAGRLWVMTYPPHRRTGSADKLYEIDDQLNVVVRAESVGGTHAGRMIHRESRQLVMGPYVIDQARRVRAVDFTSGFSARIPAVARHLQRPSRAVYLIDMEGPIWELDVHTLETRRLFVKPVPGWHAKGAATAYGRLVVANNGELRSGDLDTLVWEAPEATWSRGEEDAGVLAEYDGSRWEIVSRRPHTEVVGPGGLTGDHADGAPLWSMGWDRRSVLLQVRTRQGWRTHRVPKGSYTYDPTHGWFTEWPRIRDIGEGPLLMNMHGTFFTLPRDFGASSARGLVPLATHLHYTTDFCAWRGQVVLAGDDTSILQNPLAARPQSNLRFVDRADLGTRFGPRCGWGGPWVRDVVTPEMTSDALLVGGYDRAWLHLAHDAATAVTVVVDGAADAEGPWRELARVHVAAGRVDGVGIAGDEVAWIRTRTLQTATCTAYAHLTSAAPEPPGGRDTFESLARTSDRGAWVGGVLRPAAHSRDLTVLAVRRSGGSGPAPGTTTYLEVDERLVFSVPDAPQRAAELAAIGAYAVDHQVDAASVLVIDEAGARWRLPSRPQALPPGEARGLREVISERYLANYGGTFYEIPRQGTRHAPDFRRMKPVASHDRRITDFATWRGLLVLAGVRMDVRDDDHCVRGAGGDGALWFGAIDDLFALGVPAGDGGPWHRTAVSPGVPSDPYLMAGFQCARLRVSHDRPTPIVVRIEIDALADGTWWTLDEVAVPGGEGVSYALPTGFLCHWLRLVPAASATMTARVLSE
ncbi:hypothetical protein [Luteitalea sp.]